MTQHPGADKADVKDDGGHHGPELLSLSSRSINLSSAQLEPGALRPDRTTLEASNTHLPLRGAHDEFRGRGTALISRLLQLQSWSGL